MPASMSARCLSKLVRFLRRSILYRVQRFNVGNRLIGGFVGRAIESLCDVLPETDSSQLRAIDVFNPDQLTQSWY